MENTIKNENEVLISRGIGFPKFWIELSETHRMCGDKFVDGHNDPVNVWKRNK
jgi:polyphosphate kinase 2 (PPK2 family)